MTLLNKLKSFILPEEIDFYESLHQQSLLTEQIIQNLADLYVGDHEKETLPKLYELIKKAKESRIEKLKQLESVFITPIDREAISRAYTHLNWITLSTKHLVVELETYEIDHLTDFKPIFKLLCQAIEHLTEAFAELKNGKFEVILHAVNQVIHADNQLIYTYAKELKNLFKSSDVEYIYQHKEALTQLKEISKRIHFCANQVEDIVFKMN